MKTIFRSIILGLTGILILISARPGSAQDEPPLTVDVDRTSLSTSETLTLTISVTTRSISLKAPQPELPSLDGFNVVGSSTSSQISIINGEISTQTTYYYLLQPYQTGEVVIEPVTLAIGGQTYQSDPITIQVTEGVSTPPQITQDETNAPDGLSGQDFYVEADVDNLTPYMGESVIYTFRFYQSTNLYNQPFYAPPSFTRFWSEEQAGQSQYTTEINSRAYRVTELTTILFPTSSGPTTIEPATLTIRGSILDPDKNLVTDPIRLEVRPLPVEAPDGFNGAVGQFSIAAQMDVTEGKVNEPITLTVTISGSGNIHNLPDPTWVEIPAWRSFESQATINAAIESDGVTGSRIYERLLVPGEAADFTIPAVDYIFFDPHLAEYITISTEPIPVSISPGEAEDTSTIIIGNDKETVELLASDIRHIKSVPTALDTARKPLTAQVIYWLAWVLPLLVIAGSYG
ncbi:MAG: BatD family protein, partial [Anaerolineaceae bacterium]|nr:BatD family protein [Anaerolineaceae bacterium]